MNWIVGNKNMLIKDRIAQAEYYSSLREAKERKRLISIHKHSEIIRGLNRPKKGYAAQSKPQLKEGYAPASVAQQSSGKSAKESWWEINIDDISTYVDLPVNAIILITPKPGEEELIKDWVMYKDEENNLVMGIPSNPGKKYNLDGEVK